MLKLNEDETDSRRNFDDFIKRWRKEAKDIRDREITQDAAQSIYRRFETEKLTLHVFSPEEVFNMDFFKLESVKSELITSLKIATSNYRSTHKTLLERLIDNVGEIFTSLRRS
jgi:hypothetical protein